MFYVLTSFVKPLSRSQLNYHNSVEEKVTSQRVGKKEFFKRNFVLLVTVLASVLDP